MVCPIKKINKILSMFGIMEGRIRNLKLETLGLSLGSIMY